MNLQTKTNALMVVEILGKPKEYLTETLEKISEEISKEKDVKIVEKTIHEPVEVKDQKDIYSTFMEIEVEVASPLLLARLVFKYMPSHMEILEPEKINMTNNEYGEILSELARKLHQYDEVARVIQMEKKILENQIRKLSEGKESEKK